MAESAGILLSIKADSKQAVQSVEQFRKEVKQLEKEAREALTPFQEWGRQMGLTAAETDKLGGQLKTAGLAIGAVGAGLAVVAGIAVATASKLFDLTKSTAEFGSTIFDASQKTGLSAERLSAMKFAAEQSGSSLEQVTAATARFSKVLGDAANGSEQAEAKLKRLGVTSTDLDTALKQALATIVKVPPGAQQMALAMDAFGKSGADLLPFIKSFDGDLDALTEKAKALGVTMTDEAAAAADEFGDQLDTLNAQFAGVGRTIGTAFMPIFLNMARSLSNFLTENQEAIQRFGTGASDIISGFIITLHRLSDVTQSVTNSSLGAWASWAMKMHLAIDPLAASYVYLLKSMQAVGAESRGVTAFAQGTVSPTLGLSTGGGVPRGGGGGRAARTPRVAEDRTEERDTAAQIRIESINLRNVQEQMKANYDAMRDKLKGGDGILGFTEATNEATKLWAGNLDRSLKFLEQLENQQLKADATANERLLLQVQQEQRRHDLKLAQDKQIKENQDALFKAQKEQWEAEAKHDADKAEADQKAWELEQERLEVSPLPTGATPQIAPDLGAFGGLEGSPFDVLAEGMEKMEGLPGLANMISGAFNQMAQAVGASVRAFVLFGSAGGSFKKFVAEMLASLASAAAIQAIWELAQGFAMLALAYFGHPQAGMSATAHFIAAGVYGAIAGVAAIAGRAVAGNAFKQQTAQATGSTGANRQGSSNSEGGAYSGQPDQVIEQGINQAQPSEVHIKLGLDTDGVITVLESNSRSNGRFRFLVQNLAEGNA